MKKLAIPGFCLMMLMGAGMSAAVAAGHTTVQAENEKVQIKPEELPEAVKKTLASDEYREWTVATAFHVKSEAGYYEVNVTKGEENKTIRFSADGKVL